MLLESLKEKSMFPFKNKPKLLCDENLPSELIKLLSKDGFEIKRVILGSDDLNVGELAKSEKRVLLTLDKHFLNKAKFPPKEFSGIIFINIHPPLIESLHFSLSKLFNSVDPSDFKGRVFNLTNSGFKVFPRF